MKIIMHNSISLDDSFLNFEVNMDLHYKIAEAFNVDAHLIGSKTAKKGTEIYGKLSNEEKKDFIKPKKDEGLPYWIIPDTKGLLMGLLHEYRRFEFCRDVVILLSENTPLEYLDYLKERNYDNYVIGNEKVDLKKAIMILSSKYNIKTILTDSGQKLNCHLLNQGLIDEISLLISPEIIGRKSQYLFKEVKKNIKLKKIKCSILDKNYVWIVYKVIKSNK
jgi:2,5-diamino-6-(ribosylamino)-4(3H)-pyrimidinone 5'-phosphate reductase